MLYFKDNKDGYYQFDDNAPQEWYVNLISCPQQIVATVIPPIPTKVSMKQARLALLQFGILDKVNLAIQGGTDINKITWQFANDIDRSDTLVTQLATGLGLSATDLDNLFTLANGL